MFSSRTIGRIRDNLFFRREKHCKAVGGVGECRKLRMNRICSLREINSIKQENSNFSHRSEENY